MQLKIFGKYVYLHIEIVIECDTYDIRDLARKLSEDQKLSCQTV